MQDQDRIEDMEKSEEETKIPSTEEILKGYREVALGDMVVKIHRPDQFIIDAADKVCAGIRFSLLKSGDIPTEKELRKIYIDRGVWSETLENEMNILSVKVLMLAKEIRDSRLGNNFLTMGMWIDENDPANETIGKLNIMRDTDDGYSDIYALYKKQRKECFEKTQSRYHELREIYNELFSQTVESFVNYERQLFYCQRCYKTLDDKFVWDNVESFKNDQLFYNALQEAMRFWSDFGSEENEYFFDVLQGRPIPD